MKFCKKGTLTYFKQTMERTRQVLNAVKCRCQEKAQGTADRRLRGCVRVVERTLLCRRYRNGTQMGCCGSGHLCDHCVRRRRRRLLSKVESYRKSLPEQTLYFFQRKETFSVNLSEVDWEEVREVMFPALFHSRERVGRAVAHMGISGVVHKVEMIFSRQKASWIRIRLTSLLISKVRNVKSRSPYWKPHVTYAGNHEARRTCLGKSMSERQTLKKLMNVFPVRLIADYPVNCVAEFLYDIQDRATWTTGGAAFDTCTENEIIKE